MTTAFRAALALAARRALRRHPPRHSNHAELEREAARFDVRFEHIPVRRDAKATAEAALLELLDGSYDLIVLARYIQILSTSA